MSLTVAVTGPTGEIGLPLIAELESDAAVGAVRGMARRPFDPAAEGWGKVSYRRGDILDRGSLAALFDGADVAVHLAFAIFGDREETRRVNLEGSRNVFEAAIDAGVRAARLRLLGRRLRLPPREPAAADRGRSGARQRELLLLGAEGRAGGGCSTSCCVGSEVDAYVFRPCIVAGPRATMLIEQTVEGARLGDPLPRLRRGLGGCRCSKPVLPDPGVPIQLVHHDDVARALAAAIAGKGTPGAYNLAGEGEIGDRRHRPRARLALGPRAGPGSGPRRRHRQAPHLRLASARVGDRAARRRC